MNVTHLLLLAAISVNACGSGSSAPSSAGKVIQTEGSAIGNSAGEKQSKTVIQTSDPKTVRDFFMLLPEKYFVLEGCDREKDIGCKKAREDYLKTFGEVDIANGYIKGGCDGAQACMEMAIFKRPDGTYLVGLATFSEMMNDYYFLDHKNGTWTDVSGKVVPQFSKKNMYQLPRNGTTVQVFQKKIIEQGPDFEASEQGRKLYDLVWANGKFSIKK